jgi:hypothetical protein
MFAGTGLFWFLMGMLTVVVAAGLRASATRRGWHMTWWKWALAAAWYALFSLSFLVMGTLAGENEARAGLGLGGLGLFGCVVFGVGLWRVLAAAPKKGARPFPHVR